MYSCRIKDLTNSQIAVWGIIGLAVLLTNNAFAENPLGIPEYTQTLEITYANSEEAQNAELVKQELPGTKKIAISTRWDDNNIKRHLIMAQTLAKQGWKGTFYLYGFGPGADLTIPTEILKLGSTLGSHTLTHKILPTMHPAGIFKQITAQRIWEESNYNTCVTAFGLPGSMMGTVFKDNFPFIIGEAMKRSGHLGGAEPWPTFPQNLGLDPNFWTGSYLFNINDRDPSPELFRIRSYELIRRVTKPNSPNGPHLTLGTHTWQSDAGFEVLDNILKENGNNADWWYCQENEYIAYRYQFRHTGICKKSVNGNQAVFELTRISAPELGDNIALTVQSNGNIISATLDRQPIAVKNNRLELTHNATRTIPVEIEAIEFSQNPATLGQTENFKEIKLVFDEKNNQISFACKVPPSTKLDHTSIILRVPPAWEAGIKRATPTLSNQQLKTQFELGSRDSRSFYQDGDYNFYLQVDTVYDGIPKRLHVTLSVPNLTSADTTSPRDKALAVGPLAQGTFTPELLSQISVPNATLNDFGPGLIEKWHPTYPNEFLASYTLCPDMPDKWFQVAHKFCKAQATEYAFALDFDASAADHCKLLLNCRKSDGPIAIYINGQKQEFQNTIEFSPIPARNRVVLVYPVKAGQTPTPRMATVTTGENLFTHVRFLPVEKGVK